MVQQVGSKLRNSELDKRYQSTYASALKEQHIFFHGDLELRI